MILPLFTALFATSDKGTGVNAHDRPGGLPARYGDSASGGCGQQIRVSDVEDAKAP